MQRRAISAITGGFVAVTVGAVAVAASAAESGPSREQTIEAKLDKPHAERPAAAASTTHPAIVEAQAEFAADQQFHAYLAWAAQANYERWMAAAVEFERAKAEAAARAQRARSSRSSGSGSGSGHAGPGGTLACLRHRESRGDYGAVNGSSGAAGAYQFMPGTWNSTARSAGRPDLVGVHPTQASPGDQDAMASHLLGTQGLGPWGGACG